jgi:hydroxyethylthiazole kinase-like uncharacterized protein yjeF
VPLPIVIDGDGLWGLAETLRDEPELIKERDHPVVVTPHSGEYAFFGDEAPAPGRIAAARDLASRTGAIVHLKGRRAVTVADGDAWVNVTGNPGAATGGTGDVLTGIVGALIAQGAPVVDATWAGAFLHGRAADIAATRLGERSLAARDLPEAVPFAIRSVGGWSRGPGSIRTVLRPVE